MNSAVPLLEIQTMWIFPLTLLKLGALLLAEDAAKNK